MAFPQSTKYVIVGAGIHGLSTAYHLALELRRKGKGSGADILVPRQDIDCSRSLRDCLWRGAEQLLPTRHARADGP